MTILGGGAWSDDIDLPTAPVASFSNPSNDYSSADRMNSSSSLRREEKYSNAPVDLESIPFDPPFTAYIGNLAFDATEHDLETFFGSDIKVKFIESLSVSLRVILCPCLLLCCIPPFTMQKLNQLLV